MRRLVSFACAAVAAVGLAVALPAFVQSASADPGGVTWTTLGTQGFGDNTQCAAANAKFSVGNTGYGPTGIAFGPGGQLFVGDDGGNRVLEWPNADALTACQAATVVGAGQLGPNTGDNVEAIAVSPTTGVLAVAKTGDSNVFLFTPTTPTSGVYSSAPVVIGGHGNEMNHFNEVRGLAFLESGATEQLVVADDNNGRLQIFSPPYTNGQSALTSITGGGVLQSDKSVVVSGTNVYAANFYGEQIYRFHGPFTANHDSSPTAVLNTGGAFTGPDSNCTRCPIDLGITPDGSLLATELDIVNGSAADVAVYPHADTATGTAAAPTLPSDHYTVGGQFTANAFGIAVDPAGRLFWADSDNLRVIIENPPLAITSGTPGAGTVGTAYSFAESATGGVGADTWSVATGLPNGLSISSAGVISGTPTVAGPFTFTVSVHDSGAPVQTVTKSQTITINPAVVPLTITSGTPGAGTVGTAYSFAESASGGTGADTWSVATGLPNGLSISSGGVISGTPTVAGPFTFTVSVHDSGAPVQTVTKSQTITINPAVVPLTITSGTPGAGTVGTAYSFAESASGGTGADTWSVATGLPNGLSISSAGVISGTPTVAGPFTFTVSVHDSGPPVQTVTKSQTITINPATTTLTITSGTVLPPGTVGFAYITVNESRTGGTAPFTWSISAGALPPGLNLSTGGAISGAPSATGTFTFTVSVHDSSNPVQTASKQQSITVNPVSDPNFNFATLGTVSYTDNTVCAALNARFTDAVGGGQDGSTDLALSSSGRLFVIDNGGSRVLSWPNADALTQCQSADMVIGAGLFTEAEGIAIGPDNTLYVSDVQGEVVNIFKPNSSGTYPASPTARLGQLGINGNAANQLAFPRGLALTQQGQLAVANETDGSVRIFNAPFTSGESWTVRLTATTPGLVSSVAVSGNNLYVASYYNDEIDRFTGPFTTTGANPVTARFSTDPAHSGVLHPINMTVSPTGSLVVSVVDNSVVVPGQVQVFPNANFATSTASPGILHSSVLTFAGQTIRAPEGVAQDASGRIFVSDPGALRVIVLTPKVTQPALLMVAPGVIPTLAQGFQFGAQESVTNPSGGGPYTWTITGGALPPGLTMTSGGQIIGAPTTLGTYTFDLNVHDSSTPQRVGFLSEQVIVAPMAITNDGLPDATVEAVYSATLTKNGGKAAFVWSLAPGSLLPPGLKLSTAGKITGTVTCQGPATGCAGGSGFVTFNLHDGTKPALTASRTYYLNVLPMHITSSTLPQGTINVAYPTTKLIAVGGGTLTWSLQAGQTLPPGLKLSTAGSITGKPTTPGTYSVGVAAHNAKTGAQFQSATATIHIVILPMHITATKPITSPTTVGKAFPAFTEKALGAVGATHWSVIGGQLPPGLKITATTGQITGKATVAGTFTFTVHVSDTAKPTANQADQVYTVTVLP